MKNDQEKLQEMLAAAAVGKSGRGTIAGRLVQFKSRWNPGRSGKGMSTFWYLDGKRVAKSRIVELAA